MLLNKCINLGIESELCDIPEIGYYLQKTLLEYVHYFDIFTWIINKCV